MFGTLLNMIDLENISFVLFVTVFLEHDGARATTSWRPELRVLREHQKIRSSHRISGVQELPKGKINETGEKVKAAGNTPRKRKVRPARARSGHPEPLMEIFVLGSSL